MLLEQYSLKVYSKDATSFILPVHFTLTKFWKNGTYSILQTKQNFFQHFVLFKLPIKQLTCKESWAGDNDAATTCPCFLATKLLVNTCCLFSVWLLHLDTKSFTFVVFFLVTAALLSCYVVALSLTRSWKIAACSALKESTHTFISQMPWGHFFWRILNTNPHCRGSYADPENFTGGTKKCLK